MGGANYLRQLRGPLPSVKLLATGGVDLTTAADYLAAGAAALGVGARTLGLDLLEREGTAAVQERCGELRDIVTMARRNAADRPR